MVKKEKSIEIGSSLENIHLVEQFVEEICDDYNIFNNYFGNILVAVTEAVQNAIQHGNQNDTNKPVKIIFKSKASGLVFSIEDEGNGFDYKSVPDPTDIDNEGDVGRGLFLINTLSDDVAFYDAGRGVDITFKISSIHYETSVSRAKQLQNYLQGIKTKEHSNI